MQIGWVDFSKTERDKVVSILRLLGTQTALDELGLELFGMLSPICSSRGSLHCRHEQSIL